MATSVAIQTVTQVITKAASASASASAAAGKAPAQGGVLEKVNPVHYDAKNPIILFIVQAGIIIIFCRVLEYPLSKIRQPRVISEIIGGILLGPSVMGRIPGFTNSIFPAASIPNLNLIANLGLTLFLFMIGLEVDLRIFVNNWKVALSVGVASMVLPFALGSAIAVGLHKQFSGEDGTVPVKFGIFMLFIGVATAITAFPVLCRILVEMKLLMTPVGVIVLSAGVGNDVVGWILLALCVALVNAGDGLTALWVLLTALGFILFLVYAVRPAFIWTLRQTRALQDGPNQGIVALTLLVALASAFFTGIIGIHPIFGAFMAGIICPKDGGFNIKVTEKIEDLISAVFLPLYFALSGLNTNLGLLDSGIVWAYVIGVIAVAFFAKFTGASLAARLTGMLWRECGAIGSLMSCKGLVELIVLNIGLQAKILSTRTFTMFVVMALVTTFITTPLTSVFYPPWYRKKVEAWRRGEIDWDTGKAIDRPPSSIEGVHYEKFASEKINRLTVYLRMDNMPTLLAFASLFGGQPSKPAPRTHPLTDLGSSSGKGSELTEVQEPPKRPIEAYGIRMLNLTDRGSSVMAVSEVESYTAHDPVVNTFRTFGRLHNLAVSGEVVVIPEQSFADTLATRASDSDFLLLPWSETGGMSEQVVIEDSGTKRKLTASSYKSFVNSTFDHAPCTTAVFINKNFGGSKNKKEKPRLTRTVSSVSMSSANKAVTAPIADPGHHIFLAFFGGEDDRAALRLVLQLVENPDVTATIVHFEVPDDLLEASLPNSPVTSVTKAADTTITTRTSNHSHDSDAAFFDALRISFPISLASRVVFESVSSHSPVRDVIARAKIEVGQQPKNAGDLVVLGRNITRRFRGGGDVLDEVRPESSAAGTLGVLAERVWDAKVGASVLVVKAGPR